MSRRPAAILISVTLVAAGCQTGPTTDYTAYLDHMPDSILVLPPINHTDVDEAPTLFMQTVSKPLAEQGYYVFPVAVVDRIMRDNGAETIAEMHEVPLSKLHQLFGADAVLYIEIEAWKTSYVVVGASTHVNLAYRLVDNQSGQTLWSRRVGKSDSSAVSAGGGDPLAAAFAVAFSLVAAQVKGISDAVSDPRPRFARAVNYNAFEDSKHGVLLGPRHPKFQEDQQRHHRQDRERLVVTSGGAIVTA